MTPAESDIGTEQDPAAGMRALVARLAGEFGADSETLAGVAALFVELRERAPDLFIPAAGVLARALVSASADADGAARILAALGEWALDAGGEPIEHVRRDCLLFQAAMTRGTLRLYAAEPDRCSGSLLALQRFVFLQFAVLASIPSRGQEEGSVVRTLPTPEYAAFMEILRTAIETHRQENRQLAVLLVQTSRIEQVDRLLGLQKGEAFMLRIVRRMREGVLRKQDQVGRISRNQLACLLPRIAGEGVAILAANKILGALEAPIPIGERAFAPDLAIGVAMFPDHANDQEALVRNGKLAARAARDAPEHVAVYDPAQGASEERKVRDEMRLRVALEENLLGLAFEPQLDLQSRRIVGLEARLRWTDGELGEVPEERTIKAAESAGLILEVTGWKLNNALRQAAEFARGGHRYGVRLNVTASSLLQPDFPDFVDRALRTWNVPPDLLVIEVDETALAAELEPVIETLQRLKALGLRLAMDGFGAGPSSLSNLARLPFDELKIGALFVGDMQSDALHAKIVRALVHLALDLGLAVAAEGVGDAETAAALTAMGCQLVQGRYVSAPLGAAEIIARYPLKP
jgi:EAL domain-containing protein (putative c-di-GMP-specific phosphodiesterase class I)/GGDEF domain-containing protein